MKSLLKAVLLALALVSTQVLADLSIGLNLASAHINPTGKFNEDNKGIFIDYEFDNKLAIQVGTYENSYYNQTKYLQLGYSELVYSNSVGIELGVFTGLYEYSNLPDAQVIDDYIIAGGVSLKGTYNNFFITTQLVPVGMVTNEADAVVTLQLGYTFN